MSDSYGFRDNLDTVMALLKGMQAAGLDSTNIRGADLSDDRLYLRVQAPEIAITAESFLKDYRSPFAGTGHGGEAAENPYVVYAGLLVKNSETGGGALSITPELRIKVCDNGLQITADAMRKVHLGGRLDEGHVQWSEETRQKQDDLITAQVKDAVKSYLSVDYVEKAVAKLEEKAGTPLTKPADVIQVVAKELRFSEAEADGLLDHFIRGGQATAGGVLQAVTSFAQEIDDVDRSNDFAAFGVRAMELAAAVK